MGSHVSPGKCLRLSKLGLGGIVSKDPDPIWPSVESFRRILDISVSELGIYYLDTAAGYIDAEETIGKWLQEKGSQYRAQLTIGTKVRARWSGKRLIQPLTREHILNSMERSLAKLQLDHVDILWMHAPDKVTPWQEIFGAFDECVKKGMARTIGICNVDVGQVEEIFRTCIENGWARPAAVQNGFSLLTAHEQNDVTKKCQELGAVFMAFSPLAGGTLAGRYRFGESLPPDSRWAVWSKSSGLPSYWTDGAFQCIEKMKARASSLQISPAALALAWCMKNPLVSTTLLGPRTPEHLEAAKQALEVDFSPDEDWVKAFEKLGHV